jgi:hypothetical protein
MSEVEEPTEGRRRGKRRKLSLVLLAVSAAVETMAVKRKGYGLGGDVIVRCSQGHLFTTIWIPLASFKAVRLGGARLQRCPVGHHWSLVRPVRSSELTEDERSLAAEHRDVRIP